MVTGDREGWIDGEDDSVKELKEKTEKLIMKKEKRKKASLGEGKDRYMKQKGLNRGGAENYIYKKKRFLKKKKSMKRKGFKRGGKTRYRKRDVEEEKIKKILREKKR